MVLQETNQKTQKKQEMKATIATRRRERICRMTEQSHQTSPTRQMVAIANQERREVKMEAKVEAQTQVKTVACKIPQQRSMMKPRRTQKASRLGLMSRRLIQ